jgi:hypothetical protein
MHCYFIVAVIVHVIVGVHPKPCGSRTHGRASSWLSMYAPFDPDARMVVLANREVP